MKRLILLFSISLSLLVKSYSQINLNSGLVASFPFSGNASDSSIFSNHGAVYGAVLTADRNGNPNSAYYFDGIDDYIEVAANANLSASTYELSISVWVNIDVYNASSNKEAYILEKAVGDGYSSDWGVKYFDKDANPSVEELRFCGPLFTPWGDGGGTNTILGYWSTTIPLEDTWYHLVINHDGNNNQEIFINGVSESVVGGSSSFWQNTADLIIGKATDNSSHFTGAIDDIRIYNRILTPDEVLFLYDGTVSSVSKSRISNHLNVFPNPCNEELLILNEDFKIVSFEIFDTMGKIVLNGDVEKKVIDVSFLEKGIYFIQFTSEKGEVSMKKIIKK